MRWSPTLEFLLSILSKESKLKNKTIMVSVYICVCMCVHVNIHTYTFISQLVLKMERGHLFGHTLLVFSDLPSSFLERYIKLTERESIL